MSRSWPMLMLRNRTYYYHRTVPKRLLPLLAGKGRSGSRCGPPTSTWRSCAASKKGSGSSGCSSRSRVAQTPHRAE